MITGDLEYFISSLPYLSFQNTTEQQRRVAMLLQAYTGREDEASSLISLLEEEAGKFLSTKTHTLFCAIQLDTIHLNNFRRSRNKVVARFSEFMFQLKEKAKQLRLQRKASTNKNAGEQPESLQLDGSPLEQEIQLLQYQWEQLEELSIGHYTDVEALILYKLKLMLLLRWWGFDAKQGFEKFSELIKIH